MLLGYLRIDNYMIIQLICCILLDNTTYMLYNICMKKKNINDIPKFQEEVLDTLSGTKKFKGYYLGGGTALSRVYFHHRISLDLEFFTQKFSRKMIMDLVREMSEEMSTAIKLIGEQGKSGKVKVLIFNIDKGKEGELKIDFIEDWLKPVKKPKIIDGIPVMSLEDIYLRKIYTVTGTIETKDTSGRKIFMGGRREAKDFYDLYFLAHTFKELSEFAFEYLQPVLREALINWFRSYDRMNIKSGLLELKGRKEIDYREIENHFKKEIDKIIEKELGVK